MESDDASLVFLDDENTVSGNIWGGHLSGDGEHIILSHHGHTLGEFSDSLYQKNLTTGEVKPIPVDINGNKGTGDSYEALDMSADGRYVLFTLDAYGDVNLDPNAPAGQSQQTGPLFRKDMITGEIVRVDTLSDGSYVTPMYGVDNAVISSDGAYVAFTHGNAEYAGSTDSWPEINHPHVYWKNLKTGELKVVDTTPEGFRRHLLLETVLLFRQME